MILGILISFFSLAKLMTYLMEHHPIPLWSFFFGLIIASAVLILRDIKWYLPKYLIPLVIGTAIGAAICLLSPAETPDQLWFIFLCGAIAICAMILPGISGSFILLLLGKYTYMLNALTELDIVLILTFVAGAAIGIVSFSHFLSWLLKKYHTMTISLLAGIMIGSLLKVWPWQVILESGVSRPALPYNEMLQSSGHVPTAITFAVIGIVLVTAIELAAKRIGNKKAEVQK